MKVTVNALKRNWGMFDGDPTTIDDTPSPYAKIQRQAEDLGELSDAEDEAINF